MLRPHAYVFKVVRPSPIPQVDPVPALQNPDPFLTRHIGPSEADARDMLKTLGMASLDALIDATVPANIRLRRPLALPAGKSEQEALEIGRAHV